MGIPAQQGGENFFLTAQDRTQFAGPNPRDLPLTIVNGATETVSGSYFSGMNNLRRVSLTYNHRGIEISYTDIPIGPTINIEFRPAENGPIPLLIVLNGRVRSDIQPDQRGFE